MRAKVAGVVLVASGLFGAVAMTAAPATFQVAARDGHNGDHEHGRAGDRCVAEREVLIGPVCVTVNDVLSDILTT
jgi:hypothetical protein